MLLVRVEIQRENSEVDMSKKVKKGKDTGMQEGKVVPSRDDVDLVEGEHSYTTKTMKTKGTSLDRKKVKEGIRKNRTVEEEAHESEINDIELDREIQKIEKKY